MFTQQEPDFDGAAGHYEQALTIADEIVSGQRAYGWQCREPFGDAQSWGLALVRLGACRMCRDRFQEGRNVIGRGLLWLRWLNLDSFTRCLVKPHDRTLFRLALEYYARRGVLGTDITRSIIDRSKELLQPAAQEKRHSAAPNQCTDADRLHILLNEVPGAEGALPGRRTTSKGRARSRYRQI